MFCGEIWSFPWVTISVVLVVDEIITDLWYDRVKQEHTWLPVQLFPPRGEWPIPFPHHHEPGTHTSIHLRQRDSWIHLLGDNRQQEPPSCCAVLVSDGLKVQLRHFSVAPFTFSCRPTPVECSLWIKHRCCPGWWNMIAGSCTPPCDHVSLPPSTTILSSKHR